LFDDPYEEQTFAEFHPAGTRYDSDAAPIAPTSTRITAVPWRAASTAGVTTYAITRPVAILRNCASVPYSLN
jgi:hypothetical protein